MPPDISLTKFCITLLGPLGLMGLTWWTSRGRTVDLRREDLIDDMMRRRLPRSDDWLGLRANERHELEELLIEGLVFEMQCLNRECCVVQME